MEENRYDDLQQQEALAALTHTMNNIVGSDADAQAAYMPAGTTRQVNIILGPAIINYTLYRQGSLALFNW